MNRTLRFSLGFAAIGALTACPAEDQPPTYQPPPTYPEAPAREPVVVYPEVLAELMLVNNSEIAQLFRIRSLRPDVQINCGVMAEDPAARLVPELFGPAQAWLLDPGRAMSARPQATGGECSVVLVDGPGLEPRLIFYTAAEFASVYQSTEGVAVDGARALTVAGSAEARQWNEHPALYRLETPEEAGPECGTPPSGKGVDWSTPPTGLVALLGWSVGADGCHALDLEVGETAYRWFVCAPGVELPFAVGEDLRVAPIHAGVNGQAVEGVSIEGPQGAVTLVRGVDLPLPYTVSEVEGCEGHVDHCGSFVQAARIQVGGLWVEAGGVVEVEGGELHLYRAQTGAAINQGCMPFARVGMPVFEAAWVQAVVEEPSVDGEEPGDEGGSL